MFIYFYVLLCCRSELLLRTMRRLMVKRKMKLQIFFISTITLIITTDIKLVTMVTQQQDINTQENHLADQLLRCNIQVWQTNAKCVCLILWLAFIPICFIKCRNPYSFTAGLMLVKGINTSTQSFIYLLYLRNRV